ncbi:MAG: hypothetical protein J0L62_11610 [Bacteroidetes bacterium]|nr:hypothetical protein [Bacteroidota bacterium]
MTPEKTQTMNGNHQSEKSSRPVPHELPGIVQTHPNTEPTPMGNQNHRWYELGMELAIRHQCNPNSITDCLSIVYSEFKKSCKSVADSALQVLSRLRPEKQQLGQDILNLTELKIEPVKSKISLLSREMDEINTDPQKFKIESPFNRLNYIFLAVTLAAITLYLILFYSSALYMAMFKTIDFSTITSSNQHNLLNSVFDPNSFKLAWRAGAPILVIILGGFFILGLGYLAHPFRKGLKTESANTEPYISPVYIILGLIVDFVLAFMITYQGYNMEFVMGIKTEPWTFGALFIDPRFYLVFILGFVAYFAWGKLLSEFMMEEKNREFAKNLWNNRKNLRDELEKELEGLNRTKAELETRMKGLEETIDSYEKSLTGVFIRRDELFSVLNTFLAGWQEWVNRHFSSLGQPDKAREISLQSNIELDRFKAMYLGSVDNSPLSNTIME